MCFFEAENKSDTDKSFGTYYVDGYADDYLAEKEYYGADIDGYSHSFGSLAPGKKIKFYVTWEIDKNWKNFNIYIQNSIWEKSQAAFIIRNNNTVTTTTTKKK